MIRAFIPKRASGICNNACLTSGGGIYNAAFNGTSNPEIKNCIFSGNTASGEDDYKYSEFYNYLADPKVSYSLL